MTAPQEGCLPSPPPDVARALREGEMRHATEAAQRDGAQQLARELPQEAAAARGDREAEQ